MPNTNLEESRKTAMHMADIVTHSANADGRISLKAENTLYNMFGAVERDQRAEVYVIMTNILDQRMVKYDVAQFGGGH